MILPLVIFLLAAEPATAPVGGQLVADSVSDWQAARRNGVTVEAAQGRKVDAPEQAHADASSRGTWSYGVAAIDRPDSTYDHAKFQPLTVWRNQWQLTESIGPSPGSFARIDEEVMVGSWSNTDAAGVPAKVFGVRRWTARENVGNVRVTITFSKLSKDGEGVTVRLVHNGTQLAQETITDTAPHELIATASIGAGDLVDVVVDPRGQGKQFDGNSDATRVRVRIESMK